MGMIVMLLAQSALRFSICNKPKGLFGIISGMTLRLLHILVKIISLTIIPVFMITTSSQHKNEVVILNYSIITFII